MRELACGLGCCGEEHACLGLKTVSLEEPLLNQVRSGATHGMLFELFRIALPTGLNWFITSFTSMLVLLLLSTQNDELGMAGFGLASVLCNVTGKTLLWGLGAALDTFASQAWGASQFNTIGVVGQRAFLVLTLLVNVPLALLWLNAEWILRFLGQEDDVSRESAIYARLRLPGQFASAAVCVLQKEMVAIGETRSLVVTDVISACISFSLILGLIGGFRLGLKGAAIASSASDLLSAVILVVAVFQNPNWRKCWGGWSWECCRGWPEFLKLALPSLFMVVCEEWSWDIVTFLSGLCTTATGQDHVGQRRILAAQGWLSSILLVFYSLSFAIGRGISTVVGNSLGASQSARARHATVVGVALCIAVTSSVSGGLFASRDAWRLVLAHSAEEPSVENNTGLDSIETPSSPSIGDIVAQLMPYTAAFVWADGLQMALTGAIIGAGAQSVTTPVLLVSYWLLGLPLGAFFAFASPALGLLGIWLGMIIAVFLHTLTYLFICFGQPFVRFGINWDMAAEEARGRVEGMLVRKLSIDQGSPLRKF